MLIGLVGCPNSGKSTFFKALTLIPVEIASYPFTTIKPNQGIGYVTAKCPCKELGVKCNPKNSKCINGIRFIPVKLMDVAGLVPDAHLGKGLGNQFLDDLMQASGLIHILDCSGRTNPEGKPEKTDPKEIIKVLEREIDEWIKGIIKRNLEKVRKKAEIRKIPIEKALAEQLSGLGIKEEDIKEARKKADLESEEFASILRKISKPILIAANKIDLPEAQENYEKIKNENVIPCSAEMELALKLAEKSGLIKYIPGSSNFEILRDLPENQKNALDKIKLILEKYGSTGVQKCLNKIVFEVLNQIVVYPVENENKFSDKKGNVLPDAYLLPKDSKARDLAYKIHTDFGDKFITAINCKTKMNIGNSELKDGDIIKIVAGK